MALTRKQLKAMGIDDEKIELIIEAHAETVDGLKSDRDRYKAEAEGTESLKAELEELRKGQGKTTEARRELDALKAEYDEYKAKVAGAEAEREKAALYRALLKDAGISPERIDFVIDKTDLSGVEVEDGALKDAQALADKAKDEWGFFVATQVETGAKVETPPTAKGGEPEPRSLAEALRQTYQK